MNKSYDYESNVKEIYDKCAELKKDPKNIIFNQFLIYYILPHQYLRMVLVDIHVQS